jgi:hypothetical protein
MFKGTRLIEKGYIHLFANIHTLFRYNHSLYHGIHPYPLTYSLIYNDQLMADSWQFVDIFGALIHSAHRTNMSLNDN